MYPAAQAYPPQQVAFAPQPVVMAPQPVVMAPQPVVVAAYPQPVVAYPPPQPVAMAPPAPVKPLFIVDTQRMATHQPGVLVYSAKFTAARLNCLYCVLSCPWCCVNTETMARNTHLDVYTNGILFSKPDFVPHSLDFLCCNRQARGTFRYFDHTAFNQSVTSDGLCYGLCWGCIACQGSFGEQITFANGCCTDCCTPSGIKHFATCCTCCGIAETVFGLREDEGRKLAAIINEQVSAFRSNPQMYRLDPIVRDGIDAKTF